MDRTIALSLVGALLAGAICAYLVPDTYMPALIISSILACVVSGWILSIQNGAVNRGLISILFPINPFTTVRRSRSLVIFAALAAFVLGASLALIFRSKTG